MYGTADRTTVHEGGTRRRAALAADAEPRSPSPLGAGAGLVPPSVVPGRPAFTLAELLITIGIIGILAALLLPDVYRAYLTARVTQVRSDLRQIDLALHNYWLHFEETYPPTRLYCDTDKRHLHRCLPEELWTRDFLDCPLYDPFNPGETYRYMAVGPGYVNGNPTPISLLVPETFPQPAGPLVREGNPRTSPVKWIAWSVGPDGPPDDFTAVLQFNPADPAGWYPRDPRGIICRYHDGNCGISPE